MSNGKVLFAPQEGANSKTPVWKAQQPCLHLGVWFGMSCPLNTLYDTGGSLRHPYLWKISRGSLELGWAEPWGEKTTRSTCGGEPEGTL